MKALRLLKDEVIGFIRCLFTGWWKRPSCEIKRQHDIKSAKFKNLPRKSLRRPAIIIKFDKRKQTKLPADDYRSSKSGGHFSQAEEEGQRATSRGKLIKWRENKSQWQNGARAEKHRGSETGSVPNTKELADCMPAFILSFWSGCQSTPG